LILIGLLNFVANMQWMKKNKEYPNNPSVVGRS